MDKEQMTTYWRMTQEKKEINHFGSRNGIIVEKYFQITQTSVKLIEKKPWSFH